MQSADWHKLAAGVLILAVFLPRLTSLGKVLTIDEPLWRERAGQFRQALARFDLAGTMTTAQPGVPTTIIAGITHGWDSLALDQASLAVVNGLLILLTTFFLTRLWGRWWGLLGGFVLALEPYVVAHTRLVHTDGLMTISLLASLTAFLTALAPLDYKLPPHKRYVIVSGILAAIAILTKLFAILIVPMIGALLLLAWWQHNLRWRDLSRWIMWWALSLGITTFALWPVLWLPHSPAYAYLFKWTTVHAQGLRKGDVTSYWWFYAREIPFRLTMVTTLLLPLALLAASLPQFRKQYPLMQRTGLVFLLCGLFFAIMMSFSSEKGDRYVLFTILCLSLFALLGLRLITVWISSRATPQLALLPIITVLLFLAADDIRLHPYYLSHYNRFYPIEERHKVGLGEGLEQAAAWIKSQKPDAKVATFVPRVINHFLPDSSESLDHIKDFDPDYIVIYRGMFERGPDSAPTAQVKEYVDSDRVPVHIVTLNGLPYVWIYKHK